ncbi:MAG: nucleotide exchange factor GrpE [Clostridiales bacterium]|nr:nucleotide exchange factor GrpE [Clostridiales bacterium]
MSIPEKNKRKNTIQAEEATIQDTEVVKTDGMSVQEDVKEELSDTELLAETQLLMEQLLAEKEQQYQHHLRLQADFDNFRKRSRQERTDIINMANANLILSLLPVLDNFERALNALPESNEREGVQMIQRQLLEALTAAGLTQIEALGTDFDPQQHEAVLQSEAGAEQKGKVLGEAQKGYMLNGKLLRASMVQVGA